MRSQLKAGDKVRVMWSGNWEYGRLVKCDMDDALMFNPIGTKWKIAATYFKQIELLQK